MRQLLPDPREEADVMRAILISGAPEAYQFLVLCRRSSLNVVTDFIFTCWCKKCSCRMCAIVRADRNDFAKKCSLMFKQ